MFLGHFGLAFAAKRAAPRASLGALVLGAQLADMLWPVALLTGLERVEVQHGSTPLLNLDFVAYPYTHSLLMQIALGLVLCALVWAATRNTRAAVVCGLLVPSHWLLDWFVHVPDLPLYPGDPGRHGLGLWQSLPLTLLAESALFGVGLALYLGFTRARDRRGVWALWSCVALILVAYVSSLFGGPPPSWQVVAWSALILWLLPPWLHWADAHRALRRETR